MSGNQRGTPDSMLVEALYIDVSKLTDMERELLSNEQLFFGDLGQNRAVYTADEIAEFWKKTLSTRKVDHRRSLDDEREGLIVSSLYRSDQVNTPPLCMFCLNNDPVSTKMCGPLLWVPQFPKFFAFHYSCALIVPEVYDAQTPTQLEREFRDLSMKSIRKAASRMRKKKFYQMTKCSVCRMKGAMCGCFKTECRNGYHLPCAIAEGCFISYSDAEAAPVKYGILCKGEDRMVIEQQEFIQTMIVGQFRDPEQRKLFLDQMKGIKTFTCILCKAEIRMRPGQLFLNRIIFTSCCGGVAASCAKCFQNFVFKERFVKACPFGRCDLTDSMSNFLGLQGITMDIHRTDHHYRLRQLGVACYYNGQSMAPNAICFHRGFGGAFNYGAKTGARFSEWEKLECQGRCGHACHLKCAPGIGDNWIGQLRIVGATKWYCEDCGPQGTSYSSSSSPVTPAKRVKLEPHRHYLPSSPSTVDVDDSPSSTPSHRSPTYSGSFDLDQLANRVKYEPVVTDWVQAHELGGEANPITLDDEDSDDEGKKKQKAGCSWVTPARYVNQTSTVMNPTSSTGQNLPQNNEIPRAPSASVTASFSTGTPTPFVLTQKKPVLAPTQTPSVSPTPMDLHEPQSVLACIQTVAASPDTPVPVQGPSSHDASNLNESYIPVAQTPRPNGGLDEGQLIDRLVKLEDAVFKGAGEELTENIQRQNNLEKMDAMADELIEMYNNSRALWNTAPVDDLIRLRNIRDKLTKQLI